jgi:hypothetical protein
MENSRYLDSRRPSSRPAHISTSATAILPESGKITPPLGPFSPPKVWQRVFYLPHRGPAMKRESRIPAVIALLLLVLSFPVQAQVSFFQPSLYAGSGSQ